MKKIISVPEQKKIMLEILDYLHFICEENQIEYSLYAGTLLGAVRHKGFIPWDDDIDIVLTRQNYEKLLGILREIEHPFTLLDYHVKNYQYPFAKLCSKQTYQKSSKREVKEFGIFVDIFPYDALPNDEREQKKFVEQAVRMNREAVASNLYTYFQQTSYMKAFIKMIVFFPKYIRLRRKGSMKSRFSELDQWMQKYNNQETNFIGYVVEPYNPPVEINEKRLFQSFSDYEFEKKYYKGILDADTYLSRSYGDYMKLPSEENQKNHSFYKWYWKEGMNK